MMPIYRLAHWLHVHAVPLLPRLLYLLNRVVFGVVLPASTEIGAQTRFGYSGLGTVVHGRAVLGRRVNVGTNVTIGGRSGHAQVPVIGDDVEIGSGAKILGPVRVGDRAKIGANAVVLQDVAPGDVVVGIPARPVQQRGGRGA
ncbi:DapH/DapD/GlmU-related protein [Ideonella sp. DXS22W]|uniref:DapH/DapD/GlmU-related protein n=1 Tax=Pseudaquabacterium inlustre TaxID=2984192 RepID=A0ABU9CE14_9BURK